MVNAKIQIFDKHYEESVSYFKRLENLGKIRRGNGLTTLALDNEKSVTSSVVKSTEILPKCHCDKNYYNMADYRTVAKFKQQKTSNTCFEAKSSPGKKSLSFSFKGFKRSIGS
jgi:hypothetical protein